MATKRYLQRIAKAYPEIEQSGRWKPKIPKANEIDVEHYVQRIREAFPEFQSAGYKRIDDFGDHLMFLLNDRYIFRFVIGNKTEDIIKLLREQAVLERLKGTERTIHGQIPRSRAEPSIITNRRLSADLYIPVKGIEISVGSY